MNYTITKNKIKKIFGIGHSKLNQTYKKLGLNCKNKFNKITNKQNNKIKKAIKFFTYDKMLKIKYKKMIEFYLKLKNYKGIRHAFHRPVRGQRTHTNARTVGRQRNIFILKKKEIKHGGKKKN